LCRRRRPETVERDLIGAWLLPRLRSVRSPVAPRLAVEVKGYPGTVYARGERAGQPKPTAPTTQARHWFAQALLTAVLVGGSEEREVAIAFPDMPRFRDLITRSEWALRRLGVRVFLVGEGDEVGELLGS
jgi:hypothetical protein